MGFERGRDVKSSMGIGLAGRLSKIRGILLTEKDFKYPIDSVNEIDSHTKFKIPTQQIFAAKTVIAIIGKKFKILKSPIFKLYDKIGMLDSILEIISIMEEVYITGETTSDYIPDMMGNYQDYEDYEEKPEKIFKPATSKKSEYFAGNKNFKGPKNFNHRRR